MRGLNPKVSRKYTTVSPNTVLAHSTTTLNSELWFLSSGFLCNSMRAPQFCSSIALGPGPWRSYLYYNYL